VLHISKNIRTFAGRIEIMMKKGYRILVVFLAIFGMVSCANPISNNPEEDKTQLWPAVDSTGFWGFINEKGEMVIPAKYDRAYGFSGGKAQVYIDEDGEPLSSAGYEVSLMGSTHAFINTKGEVLFTLPEEKGFLDHYFEYGCCRYGSLRTVGMMDENFNAFIPDDQYHSGINLGVMTKDGLASSVLGYFNKSGELAISAYINGKDGNIYEVRNDFCDGIAVVADLMDLTDMYTMYERYGAINTKGEIVIDTVYSFLKSVGCNRLVYRKKGGDYSLLGLMDTQGNIITESSINWNWYSSFGDGGLMPVGTYQDGLKYGYMDTKGTMQIPYKYLEATPFDNGLAWVRVQGEGYKLINKQDEVVLSLDEGQIPYNGNGFHNGLCLIFYNDNQTRKFQYINLKGEVVYSWPYKLIN